ncbi:MAG: amino acid racemase [Clostridia bacterium]|nr:amino acid racemase [Clostridia bacterium]
MNARFILGILGGLGPMSTVRFCELVIGHTKATTDADHIDMLISSRASTPDRTAFILGRSKEDPLPIMIEEAHRLEAAGASLLVIPCNTAHYFYDGLQRECALPILNIIQETVGFAKERGVTRVGLLATEGTAASGAYHLWCKTYGLECILPSPEDQSVISSIIYNQVKQNRPADHRAFGEVCNRLLEKGCEKIILGCTELSLLDKSGFPEDRFLDSLEILAYKTILACHKTPIGFSHLLSKDTEVNA